MERCWYYRLRLKRWSGLDPLEYRENILERIKVQMKLQWSENILIKREHFS